MSLGSLLFTKLVSTVPRHRLARSCSNFALFFPVVSSVAMCFLCGCTHIFIVFLHALVHVWFRFSNVLSDTLDIFLLIRIGISLGLLLERYLFVKP